MDFNSSILKEMPREEKPKAGRLLRRVIILLSLLIAVTFPVVLIYTRTAPENAVGSWLYWFHDYVFLPIKGCTYTRHYPLSLILWGPIAFIIILWTISYLSKTPLFRRLQIVFTRKAVRKKLLHPLLIKSAEKLKKWGFLPELLEAVTAGQREINLQYFAALPQQRININSVAKTAYLTLLHTRLLTLPPSAVENHLTAAALWLETYSHLITRSTANPDHERINRLIADMTAQIPSIVEPLLAYKTPHKLEAAKQKKAGFDALSLAVDLLYLVSLKSAEIAGILLGTNIPSEKRETVVIRRLAVSSASRRAFLDRNRSRLENRSRLYYSVSLPTEPELLSAMGRLSTLIALHLSALTHSPNVGLGFLETIETLDFVLHLWEPERPGRTASKEPSGQQRLLWLINGLPTSRDYRFSAELAQQEAVHQKEIWERSCKFSSEKEGPIREEDFDLARSRVRSLFHAAGPTFPDFLEPPGTHKAHGK
jgi:hypothetical protein